MLPPNRLSDNASLEFALTEYARTVQLRSVQRWGERKAVTIVGRSTSLLDAQARAVRFSAGDSPVLITGETGTGKELFARAVYLLSNRGNRHFVAVNCAQYRGGDLLASELFGHRKGSFTGAVADQRGVFEEADGGAVFLDEVAELSLEAQAMLLRTLSEGEVVPVGRSRAVPVDVRVIAATSRDLEAMMRKGRFRRDLFYRLRHFRLRVPPLRERDEDWRLLTDHQLTLLNQQYQASKELSGTAEKLLATYRWPGNVRELRSLIETGFHLSNGHQIEPESLAEDLDLTSTAAGANVPTLGSWSQSYTRSAYEQLINGDESFWAAIRIPYLDREMSRAEVREIIARGLQETGGSYKHLMQLFRMPRDDYLKFMDFLRHHRLKPERRLKARREARGGEEFRGPRRRSTPDTPPGAAGTVKTAAGGS